MRSICMSAIQGHHEKFLYMHLCKLTPVASNVASIVRPMAVIHCRQTKMDAIKV